METINLKECKEGCIGGFLDGGKEKEKYAIILKTQQ